MIKMMYSFFNKKILNMNLTVAESGIDNNSYIFVAFNIKIIFKIPQLDDLIINATKCLKASEINKIFIGLSGLSIDDIISFKFNSKVLNVHKSLKEEGIEKDSIIYVITNKNINLKTIFIFIEYYDRDSGKYKYKYTLKMKYLITGTIELLIETYKIKFDIRFDVDVFFNNEKLDKNKRIEETQLSNNSTIVVKKEINRFK